MKIIGLFVMILAAFPACNKRKADKAQEGAVPVELDLPGDDNSIPVPQEGVMKPIVDSGESDKADLPLEPTISPATFDCDSLESGIYWFGKGDLAQKARSTTEATFFDPSKSTMIQVHGWQAGSHLLKRRSTFNYSKTDPIYGVKRDAADAWIDAGWNIGIFYWNQISDESGPNEAEEKVWGTTPFTWKNCRGKAIAVGDGSTNAVDYFYKTYLEAMKTYKGNNVRLGGHSLGNQMVTLLAHKLHVDSVAGKIESNLIPKRIALLDPWWSAATRTQTRAKDLKQKIESLKSSGMLFEWYKTSQVSMNSRSDDNAELIPIIGQTEISPDYYTLLNQASRHMSAQFLYYLTFKGNPPAACKSPCSDVAPSAATSDEKLKELMTSGARFKQILGRETAETADNTFEKVGN